MKDSIRVGIVSAIDYQKGFVQVTFPDRENAVSGKLPYFSHFYQMPEINDRVAVLYMTNGNHEGFILGKYYHNENMPVKSGPGVIHKPLNQNGAEVLYQENGDSFHLQAGTITVDGNALHFNGNTITLSSNSLTISGGKSGIQTDGSTMKIKAEKAVIEADNIVLDSPNITLKSPNLTLDGSNITLNGNCITLQGATETKVIS